MRIALTMRVVEATGYVEPRDAISHDWIEWIEARGHVPLLIPNVVAVPESYLEAVGAEALILTGGNDVIARGAALAASQLRNANEARVLDGAVKKLLPVLGVCRGLHVINTVLGGALQERLNGKSNHVAVDHPVLLQDPFRGLAGADTIVTNSFHSQGVEPGDLSPALTQFAASSDGLVEGFYHPEKPILAVQWHPERNNPAREFDDRLIGRFLASGAFWTK